MSYCEQDIEKILFTEEELKQRVKDILISTQKLFSGQQRPN